jgi:hypothetical protein
LKEVDVIDAFQMFPESSDQLAAGKSCDPVIVGASPDPYASNLIGLFNAPFEGGTRLSRQTSPRLNRIWSPAENVLAFTFAIDFHAVPVVSPSFVSSPPLELT